MTGELFAKGETVGGVGPGADSTGAFTEIIWRDGGSERLSRTILGELVCTGGELSWSVRLISGGMDRFVVRSYPLKGAGKGGVFHRAEMP